MSISWSRKKRIKAALKLLLANCPSRISLPEGEKVLLVGTPIHDNLGDHLLALAELEALRAIYPEKSIIEITTEQFMLNKDYIAERLTERDIVFLTGGGWLGDVWRGDELIAQEIVDTAAKSSQVIVLPQTIYFADIDSEFAQQSLSFWAQKSITLTLRDKNSYELASKMMNNPQASYRLLPDMALSFETKTEFNDSSADSHLLLCLREDRESLLSEEKKGLLAAESASRFDEIDRTSTLGAKIISPRNRREKVNEKLEEFANASLVITDRLHGALFAVLAGTPCIAFDNATGKVKGVLQEWCMDYPGVLVFDDPDKLFSNFAEFVDLFPSKDALTRKRDMMLRTNRGTILDFLKECTDE